MGDKEYPRQITALPDISPGEEVILWKKIFENRILRRGKLGGVSPYWWHKPVKRGGRRYQTEIIKEPDKKNAKEDLELLDTIQKEVKEVKNKDIKEDLEFLDKLANS